MPGRSDLGGRAKWRVDASSASSGRSVARPDRARRRGHLPRLGRRGLDLPLARPARARLRRLGAARRPRPARRESDEDARFCRELRRRGRRRPRRPDRGRAARPPLRGRGRPAPRDRPHRVRPGRDRPLPPRLERRATAAIKARREDGVVRPLLASGARRPRRTAARGLPFRVDSSNRDTKRGLIRDEILPLLERSTPRARANLLRLAERAADAAAGARRAARLDRRLEAGRPRRRRQAVREYDRSGSSAAGRARGRRALGAVAHRDPTSPGLKVRGWRPGDRLAGRSKKIQDVFVDAKIPRSEREAWPLVVRGDEVVAVPGIVEAPGARRRVSDADRAGAGRRRGPDRRGRAAAPDRRARRGDLRRLRGPRPAAGRRPQGRRLLHGRPDAAS